MSQPRRSKAKGGIKLHQNSRLSPRASSTIICPGISPVQKRTVGVLETFDYPECSIYACCLVKFICCTLLEWAVFNGMLSSGFVAGFLCIAVGHAVLR